MAAYQDGMTKLLWPERRLGIKSIKVTTEDSALPPMVTQQLAEFVPGLDVSLLRVPKGTPINLLMNVHPKDLQGCCTGVCGWSFAGRAEREVR